MFIVLPQSVHVFVAYCAVSEATVVLAVAAEGVRLRQCV